jgi:hypothetical protein
LGGARCLAVLEPIQPNLGAACGVPAVRVVSGGADFSERPVRSGWVVSPHRGSSTKPSFSANCVARSPARNVWYVSSITARATEMAVETRRSDATAPTSIVLPAAQACCATCQACCAAFQAFILSNLFLVRDELMVATVHDHCVQRRLAVLVRRAAKANRAVASALQACHMPKSAAAYHHPLPRRSGS